ncbi:MAG: hypothetical protein GY820_28665 [Gammaproteobacteria bacterium]|nr:hypothetical protein [Gammaproteobacteria bacterium]
MICYKDMTFCAAECVNRECRRNYSPEVHQGARKWWSHDPDNAPIALRDFSALCDDFMPHKEMFK